MVDGAVCREAEGQNVKQAGTDSIVTIWKQLSPDLVMHEVMVIHGHGHGSCASPTSSSTDYMNTVQYSTQLSTT